MAQLSSYDSGNPETPETDDSVDVSTQPSDQNGPSATHEMILSAHRNDCFHLCIDLKRALCLFQSQVTTVPAAPPQTKTKAPREEDFENIKLISNGAYG